MKVLALAISAFLSLSVQAKIWRVNNNVGIAADFTTIQAAHNGAASGDTVYVEGSNTSYGTLTCSKQLTIIGPGYFLDQVPNTQALMQSARMGNFTLNSGSAGTSIIGLDFNGSTIDVYVNDITIRKSRFSSSNATDAIWTAGFINLWYVNNNSSTGVSNIVISQNFGVAIAANYASNSILITNNVLGYGLNYGENTTNPCISGGQNTTLLIQNNIVRRGKIAVYGSTVMNNIMVNGYFDPNNNLYANNIGNATQFGADNGNQSNVAMTDVFANTGAPDQAYKLKAGSLAIGTGYGSTAANQVDCGIYGGSTPYVVAGQANMPAIYYFSNQPIGSNTDPIKVTVKVKAAGN